MIKAQSAYLSGMRFESFRLKEKGEHAGG